MSTTRAGRSRKTSNRRRIAKLRDTGYISIRLARPLRSDSLEVEEEEFQKAVHDSQRMIPNVSTNLVIRPTFTNKVKATDADPEADHRGVYSGSVGHSAREHPALLSAV